MEARSKNKKIICPYRSYYKCLCIYIYISYEREKTQINLLQVQKMAMVLLIQASQLRNNTHTVECSSSQLAESSSYYLLEIGFGPLELHGHQHSRICLLSKKMKKMVMTHQCCCYYEPFPFYPLIWTRKKKKKKYYHQHLLSLGFLDQNPSILQEMMMMRYWCC